MKVDYTDMVKLSRDFTAVLVELNKKHPIPKEVEWTLLKTLRHVFTTTTNEFKRNITNIKFKAELEETHRNDEQYQNRSTLEIFMYLCEGLIVNWERLHNDSASCGVKERGERNKKARGEVTGYKPLLIATMGEYCEGCGIPRHKQKSCNLKDHPDLG